MREHMARVAGRGGTQFLTGLIENPEEKKSCEDLNLHVLIAF